VIALVHGLGVGQRYFDPLAAELGGELLRPKLDEPAPIGALAAQLEARLDRPCVLVGHSMGCQVVAALAARRRDLVEALVLVGPTVDAAARTVPRQLLRLGLDAWYEPLRLTALVLSEYSRHGSVAQVRHALADRIEERLPRIDAPAVVVRGANDPLCPSAWARRAAELLPDGRLVTIASGGHAVHWSHPREVAATVAAAAS
jgi:pimeloyl-ACP methyl ester carboxylesterase